MHDKVAAGLGRFLGMISVADLVQVIASDHKARADMLEAFAFPQRKKALSREALRRRFMPL
jgi:hypothetical protein